jgi:hypothetical protein
MTEYSRYARGSFVSNGAAEVINLPFQPTTVQLWNYGVYGAPAQHGVASAYWDISLGQGYAMEQVFNATPVLTTDVVTSNGISTFAAGLALQYGPSKQIIGATAANPIVFNVTNHGYSVGTVVVFSGLYQTPTTGMPQIAGMPFVVSAVEDANHFAVVWPGGGSNYTALSGSPAGATVKQVLYPYLYAPGVAFIEAIATGTTTTVTTTAPHNYVVGQEIAFRIPQAWGTTQLNSLPDNAIPGSPIYGYVISVPSSTSFICNINSTGYTAFNTNLVAAPFIGQSFPQVVAVGDVNSGGTPYSGGALYPSPLVNGVPTINGPAISGAFVNNTSQGFIIGTGGGTNDPMSSMVAGDNMIVWVATYG